MFKKLFLAILFTTLLVTPLSVCFAQSDDTSTAKAEILQYEKHENITEYTVKMLTGDFEDEIFTTEIDSDFGLYHEEYEKGDKVSVYIQNINGETSFDIQNSWYFDKILIWIAVLLVIILILGRKKGIKSIASLGLSLLERDSINQGC